MTKRVTITDIAKAAGISPTTVSLILNGKGERFSQETCEKVLSLQEQLGYRVEKTDQTSGADGPHRLKRIGVVIPSFNRLFYDDVIIGVKKSAGPDALVTIYEGTNIAGESSEGLRWIFDEQLDGLILCGSVIPAKTLYEWSNAAKLPIIIVNSEADINDSDVWIDTKRAGVIAAEYLLDNGHRHIAVVLSEDSEASNKALLDGFRQGMHEYHEELVDKDIYKIKPSLHAGYMLAKGKKLSAYTAVFAAGDEMAVGIMRGMNAIGRKVPADNSVLGMGNLEIGAYTVPQLSSIAIPTSDIGRAAFDKLEELSKNVRRSRELLSLPVGINKRFSIKHI